MPYHTQICVKVQYLHCVTAYEKVCWTSLTHSLPQSTLVDLTFQSLALRSFSLNQLR